MYEVFIREYDFSRIELYRVALSQKSSLKKLEGISAVQHQLDVYELEERGEKLPRAPEDDQLIEQLRSNEFERSEGIYHLAKISSDYDRNLERKLNVAEEVGHLIWETIQKKKFRGLHTKAGILEHIGHIAGKEKIQGARDKDVLRKIWDSYRGVVHFGMALNFCEEELLEGRAILEVAEEIRCGLSTNCPMGTQKPYVPEEEQFKFTLKSNR